MFSLHTQNHLQTLLAKIQAGVLIHDQALVEAEKINKLDLKKAPKVKDKDSEAKPHEQDNPVDDEEHRCATDDMGMQNPDKMPKDKDREDVVVQLEGKVKEGRFTRMASTDEQEQAIQRLETALQKLGKRFVGGTTIGKDPQRVVLDLKYQGSEVRVDSDGQVEINNQPLDMDYDDESLVEELKGLLGGERNHQTEEASVKSSGARVAQLESKTNEAATGRDLEGFVRFATAEEAFLWEDEILGQLSDGAWENATPHDHWQAWGRAGVEVGSPAGYYGFRPKRTSYGLNSLIEYIGDRMQTHLGLMRILKAKGVNPDEFKHNLLPDDPADFDSTVKYAQGDAKNTDTKYWAEKLQKWQDMGITREMVVMAKEKTSETDLRKVLRGIQKTIKIRLPDAGPEKGPELEKEPELKKEEPKVTRPEKVDLLAPGRKKPETPRGEPGAKKFPTFSKEGKIPSKPSEAGEEETKKALKEEDQSWDVFDRLEGLANQKRLKQLGSLVQELLNDFTDEGLEAEDVEEYLFGKVKDIITSQGLAGRKIEGKAPISTDTAKEAEKKLLEDWSNSPEGVDSVQLTQGIEIEMEHTTDPEEAKKIALDHLAEDPRYYTKLKKMEAGACDDVQVEEGSGPEEEQYKISPKDLDVLKNAIAAKKLENGYPSEEEMIDQLSQLEDIVDAENAEAGDVRMMWLKYVQIPKAYALVGESKIKEDASASFRDRLFAFLDHSWQEDTEIEVVKMINQYRAKFQTAPVKAVQDYLRNFVKTNTILSNQNLSDAFTSQLEELMGKAARAWEGKQLPFEGKLQEGICWECGGKTEGKEKFCCPECEATHEDRPEEKEEWTDPQMESTVVGPSFEAETLMKEVLAAMKKYKWNYEEAVKGFAAKNDMDPAELEQLLSKAIESGHSSDRPVREQGDGIVEEIEMLSPEDDDEPSEEEVDFNREQLMKGKLPPLPPSFSHPTRSGKFKAFGKFPGDVKLDDLIAVFGEPTEKRREPKDAGAKYSVYHPAEEFRTEEELDAEWKAKPFEFFAWYGYIDKNPFRISGWETRPWEIEAKTKGVVASVVDYFDLEQSVDTNSSSTSRSSESKVVMKFKKRNEGVEIGQIDRDELKGVEHQRRLPAGVGIEEVEALFGPPTESRGEYNYWHGRIDDKPFVIRFSDTSARALSTIYAHDLETAVKIVDYCSLEFDLPIKQIDTAVAKKSVKEQEEVQYVSVADGIVDKKTADDLATKVKGTVATDDNDPKKFKVITRKDLGTV